MSNDYLIPAGAHANATPANGPRGFTPEEAQRGWMIRGNTKVYCCYGMYSDIGHSPECKYAVIVKYHPHRIESSSGNAGVPARAAPHPDHWICGQPNCAPCAARGAGGAKRGSDAS
jgi:hypothetical protein